MNEIIQIDNLKYMKTLPDNYFSLGITSPPYNIGKNYTKHEDNRDDYLDWLLERLLEFGRVCNQVWINVGYRKLSFGNIPIAFEIYKPLTNSGLFLQQHITWEYGAGMTYRKRFNFRHEDWLWFTKDDNYTFNLDAVRDPSLTKYKNDKRNNPNGKLPGTVWYFPHVAGNFKERKKHPAQFPEAMIERIIRACSNEGDSVFDPFNGSGTTTYCAYKLGRKFVGTDISREYCNIAIERLKP